jgi:type IV pilus assembly protein PilE
MEMLVVIVVVGILAAIALPSYQGYIKKSRAQTAAADLVALAAVVEGRFQRSLAYPAADISGTAALRCALRSVNGVRRRLITSPMHSLQGAPIG